MPDTDEEIGNALKERSLAEFAERTKGKPTPTQAENDRHANGEYILNHEADGADLDEAAMPVEARKQGGDLKEKSMAEYAERMKGKPTPTQAENDRAADGEHLAEHEPDGSDPDEGVLPVQKRKLKQMEAAKPSGGGYRTRMAAPTPQPPPAPPPEPPQAKPAPETE